MVFVVLNRDEIITLIGIDPGEGGPFLLCLPGKDILDALSNLNL